MKTKTEKQIDDEYENINQLRVNVIVHQKTQLEEFAEIFAGFHQIPPGPNHEKAKHDFIKAYKFIVCMHFSEKEYHKN
jgi:hypothetical protein